jgi:outer membrane protein
LYHNLVPTAPSFLAHEALTGAAPPPSRLSLPAALAFALLTLVPLAPAARAMPALPQNGQPAPTYSLDDCLQLALDRNPAILKAQHDIERSQGLIIEAKSTLYPQVGASGQLEERNDDFFKQGTDPTAQRFRDFWIIQLQVSQSLYSGGANRQSIAIAKLTHEAALIQLQATIDGILQEVKTAVYGVVIDKAQLEAQKLTIDLLRKEGSRQKDLFDAGRTTRFNVLRTQVSLGNQQAQLSRLQTDLVAQQIMLSQLLNIAWARDESPFEPPFRVEASLDCPPLSQVKVEDFIALALERRPELQVIDRQIDIGQRQIKIDKAANIPRISAYIADQQFRDQTLSQFNESQNAYAVGLIGSWDVFDGWASRGQTMVDTAALASQHVSRDELRLQIEGEVRESYARLLTAQATIQEETTNQANAEESVKLARISADSGYATLLDVLQATLDLNSARSDLIRSRQLYLVALADLEHAISLKFVDWPSNAAAIRTDAEAHAALAPASPPTSLPPATDSTIAPTPMPATPPPALHP